MTDLNQPFMQQPTEPTNTPNTQNFGYQQFSPAQPFSSPTNPAPQETLPQATFPQPQFSQPLPPQQFQQPYVPPQQAPTPYSQAPYAQAPINPYAQPAQKMNIVALLGFIFSLVPIVIIWFSNFFAFLGFALLIAGLICSIIGFNQTKHDGLGGHALGLAGIIISSVVLGLIIIIFFIAFAAGMAFLGGVTGYGLSYYGTSSMMTSFFAAL